MILKALYDYYNRADDLAPAGMEYKEIGFLIVIDLNGKFLRFEDRRIDKKRCQKFLVSKGVSRTSAPKANLLWDNSSYVLGYSGDQQFKQKSYQKFIDKVDEALTLLPDNRELIAVHEFYQQDHDALLNTLKKDSLWDNLVNDINKNISFLIEGKYHIIAENKQIIEAFNTPTENSEQNLVTCLITGNKCTPVATTTATSIPGSQATAKLVAFQVNSGYDSYGKSQGANAPISEDAQFAYTTALNRLLSKDSQNKFVIGNRTYVFWASSKSEAASLLEQGFFALFGNNNVATDDPNRNIHEVKDVFIKISPGDVPCNSDDKFYVLGLSPNSARIAVIYWQELSVKDFAKNLLKHFDDMKIIDNRPADKRKPYSGIHSMMSAITLGGKSSDVQPNLPDAVIGSIIQASPYPAVLYNAAIRRIRAEQNPSITRVAILKAYLNRNINYNNKEITVMLDKENNNIGYLCGRLFAVLEYIQYRANGATSIRERYMNSASSTPAAVFPTLLNLSNHHSEKLDKGAQIYCEKLKGEIIDKFGAIGFPKNLDINDQGRFFIGYYHQRQDQFTKSETKENEILEN